MHPKWIISLAILFLGGTILSGLLDMQYIGSGEASLFQRLIEGGEQLNFSNPITGIYSILKVGWTYMQLIWAMFWWDYSFFYGSYEIIRYFCWTISVGIIVSLILSITRGTSSA